jgi:hypothetical protein
VSCFLDIVLALSSNAVLAEVFNGISMCGKERNY